MRSFDKCLANHEWFIHRRFPGAKFYVCTEDDADAEKANLLRRDNELDSVTIRVVKQPEMILPHGCPHEWTPGKPYMHEPYFISVPPAAVMGQLWMLREAWRLYEEAGDPAELIIRIRPDLWFHSFEVPRWFTDWRGLGDGREAIACTPWWGRFAGVNDRFALLGMAAASHYFWTYDKIPALIKAGAPLHPETLVAESMKHGRIDICDDLKAEFSTLRTTGEMRPPEITMIDLAHFKG